MKKLFLYGLSAITAFVVMFYSVDIQESSNVYALVTGNCTTGSVVIDTPASGETIGGTKRISFSRYGGCTDTITLRRARIGSSTGCDSIPASSWTGLLILGSAVANPGTGANWITPANTGGVFCVRGSSMVGTAYSDMFTVDNVAPAIPTVLSVAGNNGIGASELTSILVTGYSDTGTTVQVSMYDGSGNSITVTGATSGNTFSIIVNGALAQTSAFIPGIINWNVKALKPTSSSASVTGTTTYDNLIPTATVSYSTMSTTSANVVVTLTGFNKTGITISGGSNTYTFTGNGIYRFTFTDSFGNTGTTMAEVTRITGAVVSGGGSSGGGSSGGGGGSSGGGNSSGSVNSGNNTGTGSGGNNGSGNTSGTTINMTTTGWIWSGYLPMCTMSGFVSGTVVVIDPNWREAEFESGLWFMKSYQLTKFESVVLYRPKADLTRQEAAKIFSQFAINILCKVPNTAKNCTFSDIDNADPTLLPYITTACQLDIMNGAQGKFRPFDKITRVEAIAVMMRMLIGKLDETVSPRYANYVGQAKLNETIKGVLEENSRRTISRYEVTLILYRIYKNIVN